MSADHTHTQIFRATNNTAPQSDDRPCIPKRNRIYEAEKKIDLHAKFMLGFSYQTTDLETFSPTLEFIKTLAFLFNFHRYNLASLILHNPEDEDRTFVINLRTLAVHTSGKIYVDKQTILDSQEKMKNFLPTEVAELKQKHSHYWLKSDERQEELVRLAGNSVGKLTLESIQTLPLYQVFQQYTGNINTHLSLSLSDNFFRTWIRNQIIPFINYLHAGAKNNKEDHFYALKMLIIIIGEYCKGDRRYRLQNDPTLVNFMSLCRNLRNTLAHKIFDPEGDLITDLVDLGKIRK